MRWVLPNHQIKFFFSDYCRKGDGHERSVWQFIMVFVQERHCNHFKIPWGNHKNEKRLLVALEVFWIYRFFFKKSQDSSDCNWTRTHNHWSVWLNGWVFVNELSGCAFESSCCHLNFRFRTCFEQGVPWHSGTYRVSIHSETLTWHDKNIQSQDSLTKIPTYLPSRMEYRWTCMLHEKFKEILSEMEYKNLSVK